MLNAEMYLQGIYSLAGIRIFSECLCRPLSGVSAEEFFKNGNPEFDLSLAKEVAVILKANKKMHCSINIHPVSMANAVKLAEIFSGVESQIILEILEHDGVELFHYEYFAKIMKNFGIKIALDDVNNNSRFKQILFLTKPDIVKIDFPENQQQLEQFNQNIELIKAFNKSCTVVVERVSGYFQLIWLRKNLSEMNILGQGYALNTPAKLLVA